MVRVLCIGQYDREGKFTKEQWKCFIKWCRKECNKIIIYSSMTYRRVCSQFFSYCNINVLEKPDESLDVYAYEIDIINGAFWNYIEDFNFNIDIIDNISYIFFFSNKKNIASLQIVDFENYLIIEEPIIHQEKLQLDEMLIQENIQSCIKGKADVDELLQEESWKPFGKA